MPPEQVIDQATIDELVRRIVETVHPRRVILFGSAARGQLGPDSDIDVLVVMPDGVHRRRTAQMLYRSLMGFGISKDIVVVTESDVQNYGDNAALIIRPALEDGKELYRAAG